MQPATKKLYIIDGYGFVFRAYHSMPPLTNSAGTPVGAIYGFTNMLIKLLKEHKPDYMCVALDSGKETFRTTMYPAYKANRPPAPEDLIPQFPLVRDVIEAVGLKSFELVGYEADDVIATFTKRALEQGIEVTIVSSDKDLMQLVDDGKVQMYDAMKAKYISKKEVFEKFGVAPAQVLDACALIGDSSDNVPGAAGIGPKTAAELINEYGDLDSLLNRAGEIKQPKRREVLLGSKEQILLSRELIRLHYDVPLAVDFTSLEPHTDNTKLITLCQTHGFKSLLAKLGASNNSHSTANAGAFVTPPQVRSVSEITPRNDVVIKTLGELKNWLKKVEGKLSIYFVENVGISLAAVNNACFIKFASSSADLFAPAEGLTKDEVIAELQPILDEPSITKILHNKKDQHLTPNTQNLAFDDIQVMEYVVHTGLDGAELEDIAPEIPLLKEMIGSGKAKRELKDIPAEELAKYGCAIAAFLYNKHAVLKQELFQNQLLTVYEKIDKRLINVLAKMEARGAKIDVELLAKMSADFEGKLKTLETEIHQMAECEFNIGSPSQLGEVLFDKMKLEGGKKSKKSGHYGTGADVLEELSLQGAPIADKVLEWRQISKLKSTYTDALPHSVNPKTGRVHTSFNMTVTSTGRLSSTNPNLQNIPIRSEEGRKIRNTFIAEKGYKLISADYSQIELRLLAHVADIVPLKEAFKNGEDVHSATARQVFGVTEVDAEHRRMAKTINFGIIYGLSAHGLAQRLGIGRDVAAKFIEAYFRQYPGIKDYMNRTIEACRKQGYVETIFGRKLYIKGINDKNGGIRQFSERAAINAPLQGSAADIIKKAMIELDRLNLPMILQVHDELLLEVAEADAAQVMQKVKSVMEKSISLSVPIVVDAKIGNNWGEAH